MRGNKMCNGKIQILILKFLEKQTRCVSQARIGRETSIEDQGTSHHRDWKVKKQLEDLGQKCFVKRSDRPRRKNGSEWKITEKGRKHLNLE